MTGECQEDAWAGCYALLDAAAAGVHNGTLRMSAGAGR